MEALEQRIRGVQPGNLNALKHGYYSEGLKRARQTNYCSAGDVEGVDEEIAVLRLVIKEAVVAGDDKHLMTLVRAVNSLNRLLRTRDRLFNSKCNYPQAAIDNVLRKVAAPLGIGLYASPGPEQPP